jgi:hypothetical protein
MPRNVYTLDDVAALTATLNVACRKCGRRGRVHTARLVREYGPDKPMPDLTRPPVGECPRLRSADIYDRRDAHCPDLSALFTRGDSEARHPRTGTNDDRDMDTLVLAKLRTRLGPAGECSAPASSEWGWRHPPAAAPQSRRSRCS